MKILSNIIVLASLSLFLCGSFTEATAQNIPTTNVPAGFGRYCSVTYPGGGWALLISNPGAFSIYLWREGQAP
ncbi:MAG: hypothetical protein M3Q33_10620 [Acidobacteriota bacterium]|nr:hypothetical protein [Acidobacteriota bacterium]